QSCKTCQCSDSRNDGGGRLIRRGAQNDVKRPDFRELEVGIARRVTAPPKVAVIVFQDELAFVAVWPVDEEVPNANGLAGLQGQDQILPFLHIRLHIAWMIRELNDAHLIKGDDVSDLFQV